MRIRVKTQETVERKTKTNRGLNSLSWDPSAKS